MPKKINIHSVRVGFATNSSSSHSIIFLPGGAADSDVDSNFGWDFFTAGSKEEKLRYLAITVHNGMSRFTSSEIAGLVTAEWLGAKGFASKNEWGEPEAGTIDHQSMLALPSNWEENALHKGFVEDFRDYLLQDEIVILGGNDNTNEEHHLLALGTDVSPELFGCSVARWDARYKYWTLFNRYTGEKIRMSFDSNTLKTEVKRSSAPELVDLKITDFCPFGCDFCYQGSTPEGKHATRQDIYDVISMLSQLNVFELAIGGGEPTLHPDFLEILEQARRCNVIPNFTTKNTAWIKNPKFRERALAACGAFAYSASSASDATAFIRLAEEHEIQLHSNKFNIQLVMGVVPEQDVEEIMLLCGGKGVRLTLLGYKTAGRGGEYKSLQYRDWLNAAMRTREKHPWGFQLGIDTVLAAGFDAQLKEAGVDTRFYETKEGLFSMYIDAVNSTAGPSSFCSSEEMKDINLNSWSRAGGILELFQGFE